MLSVWMSSPLTHTHTHTQRNVAFCHTINLKTYFHTPSKLSEMGYAASTWPKMTQCSRCIVSYTKLSSNYNSYKNSCSTHGLLYLTMYTSVLP
jgi:hypothetical protein